MSGIRTGMITCHFFDLDCCLFGQKMRENATAWIRLKKYNHHLSRRGYVNKELDIVSYFAISIFLSLQIQVRTF